jgi:hypothetical protein
LKFEKGCVQASEKKDDPPLYKYKDEGVVEAGIKLSRLIDPKRLLDPTTGPRHPLVILSFDESHVLIDTSKNQDWTVFSELRRVLCELAHLPIFFLFLSTTGKVLLSSPPIESDPSLRVRRLDLSPLNPISEISFDDLAHTAIEGEIMLSQVVQTDWISHLGRPLYVHLHDHRFKESNHFILLIGLAHTMMLWQKM